MGFDLRNSRRFCEITPEVYSGQRVIGGYLLSFAIRLLINPVNKGENPQLHHLTAELWIETPQRSQKFIGQLQSTQGPAIHQAYDHVNNTAQGFGIKLSFSDLNEIEKERCGGDVTFLLKIKGMILEQGDYRPSWEDRTLRIEQSAWIKVLDQMGYSKFLLIEVPTSGENSNPAYNLSYAKLEEAQQAMLRGQWRQSVALCRDCLETLPTFPEDEISPNKENTKKERLQLIQKLMHLTHLAKHSNNDVANNTEWQREDALFMLATCGALIHKLSKSES